ncbi:MAG: thiamine-phosphate kinase [Actinomycetota bacterium]|nr:thiamine-phosphate kinase [Actinomycetota bacterium]
MLPAAPRGETWIGDDAAVVRAPGGAWLLLATDAVVAGVHADLTLTGLDDLGWKALAVNVSDVAAMGGRPGHALVTVAGPPDTDLGLLYQGIRDAAGRYDCPVVGGDLTNAPGLVICVAITGWADGPIVTRSGARTGDGIWVTGPLGRAAAGLRILQSRAGKGTGPKGAEGPAVSEAIERDLMSAHARPEAALAEGHAAARGGATAMIDVSDGLVADLGHIADASGVGFTISGIPVAEGATEAEALGGGEDYVLVFCAPDAADIAGAFRGLAQPVRIGTCVAVPSTRTLAGRPLERLGWEHHWGG